MSALLEAFILGNSAILTNVCILPLYPGLLAFLAGQTDQQGQSSATRWLGLFVLAGVLTLMIAIGGIFFFLKQPISRILPFLLPIIYAIVILMGILLLSGRNPFKGLTAVDSPTAKNPFASAYLYGLLLGPMTLPCTGPVIVSAFLLGAGSTSGLSFELLYFTVFGLGFGWPLVLLPFIAGTLQRRFIGWMTANVTLLNRVSGGLLIAIGLFGIYADLLTNL
ncbi:MAG: cytochrome c biogenesis protein CcdA [Ardenticatenaceae bacterium]|nr:cytochrome c biogenesis protein CcdA [Ardenticatenaceae bacterium]